MWFGAYNNNKNGVCISEYECTIIVRLNHYNRGGRFYYSLTRITRLHEINFLYSDTRNETAIDDDDDDDDRTSYYFTLHVMYRIICIVNVDVYLCFLSRDFIRGYRYSVSK